MIIHVVGPNAVGKTTAVTRWYNRYSGLKPISLDNLRKPGYDTAEEKSARVEEWRQSHDAVVQESSRTTQLITLASCDSSGKGGCHQGRQANRRIRLERAIGGERVSSLAGKTGIPYRVGRIG